MKTSRRMARACAAACAGVALTVSAGGLEISEVCARCQPKAVPACKDLGWIEFHNGTDAAVNLKDYKLLVLNRGKKVDPAKNILALDDREIAPGAYALVYTSEEFGNKKVAAVEDTFAGRGTITVYPKKLNQKKYPYVQLFKAGAEGDELVQTVVVPVDLADEASYTTVPERRILATPTPGAANVYGDGDVAYGPNISSLYGVKDAPDPWQAFPKAEVGQDYAVSFPVNPADMSEAADDAIASVQLIYQIDFGGEVAGPVMTKAEAKDKLNELKIVYPRNQQANLLSMRIDQILDLKQFNETFKTRVDELKRVNYANRDLMAQESYSDLQDLYELSPNYPGLADFKYQVELTMGLKQKNIDAPANDESQAIARKAQQTLASAGRDPMALEAARKLANQALAINSSNDLALSVLDEVALRTGSQAAVVLSAADEAKYQQAITYLQNGNVIAANSNLQEILKKPANRRSAKVQKLQSRIKGMLN